jgi:hypothetical protein
VTNCFGDNADWNLSELGCKVYVPNAVRDAYVTKITALTSPTFKAEEIIGV